MSNNTTIKKEEIMQVFEKKFGSRLNMLEAFYQNHNGEPWEDKTIPEWLTESLDSLIATAREETIQELINIFKDRDPLEQYTTNVIMLELRGRLKQSPSVEHEPAGTRSFEETVKSIEKIEQLEREEELK